MGIRKNAFLRANIETVCPERSWHFYCKKFQNLTGQNSN